jgi:hypothetical protein
MLSKIIRTIRGVAVYRTVPPYSGGGEGSGTPLEAIPGVGPYHMIRSSKGGGRTVGLDPLGGGWGAYRSARLNAGGDIP